LKINQNARLITGVAGCIVSNALKRLLISSQKALCLDNFNAQDKHNIEQVIHDVFKSSGNYIKSEGMDEAMDWYTDQ
jgi:nucleoside-diphosphate-sugar epimerase